jgi:hypothetical protein
MGTWFLVKKIVVWRKFPADSAPLHFTLIRRWTNKNFPQRMFERATLVLVSSFTSTFERRRSRWLCISEKCCFVKEIVVRSVKTKDAVEKKRHAFLLFAYFFKDDLRRNSAVLSETRECDDDRTEVSGRRIVDSLVTQSLDRNCSSLVSDRRDVSPQRDSPHNFRDRTDWTRRNDNGSRELIIHRIKRRKAAFDLVPWRFDEFSELDNHIGTKSSNSRKLADRFDRGDLGLQQRKQLNGSRFEFSLHWFGNRALANCSS